MDLEKLKFDTENNLSGFYASGSLRRINDELSYYKIWHFDPVNKKFISIQVNPKGSVYEFLESFNWNEKTESIWRGSYKVVVNNENVWLITKGLYSPEQGNMDDYQEEVFLVQGKTLQQYKYGQKLWAPVEFVKSSHENNILLTEDKMECPEFRYEHCGNPWSAKNN